MDNVIFKMFDIIGVAMTSALFAFVMCMMMTLTWAAISDYTAWQALFTSLGCAAGTGIGQAIAMRVCDDF